MELYNYRDEVTSRCVDYIKEHEIKVTDENKQEVFDDLYDDLFVSDYVTGNASGSYFCNSYKAAQCLIGNFDLMKEAYEEFGGFPKMENFSEEAADVTIRCYLLNECLTEAIQQIIDEKDEN